MAHPHFLSLTHTLTHTHTHTHTHAHTHTHTHTHRIVLMNSIIVSLWKVSSKFHLKSTGENTPCLLLMIAIRYDHTLSIVMKAIARVLSFSPLSSLSPQMFPPFSLPPSSFSPYFPFSLPFSFPPPSPPLSLPLSLTPLTSPSGGSNISSSH